MKVKMNMAMHYLTTTDHSVEAITALLGYNHRNSLAATFKKIYGMSPNEYRMQEVKNKKDIYYTKIPL